MVDLVNPDVSFIIPVYNNEFSIKYVLSAIKAQNCDCNLEVIVVDDGSSDNTGKIVSTYKGKINVKYIYMEDEGFRVARARNVGIKNSTGELVIFIDGDVVIPSFFVSNLLNKMKDSPKSAFIGVIHNLYCEDSEAIEIDYHKPDEAISKLKDNGVGDDIREQYYKKVGYDLTKLPAPWVYFWGGCIALYRKDLIRTKLFDENYKSWGSEDIDLGLSLFINGIQPRVDRNICCLHINSIGGYEEERYKSNLINKKYLHNKYNLKITKLLVDEENIFKINDIILKNPSLYIE